MIIRKAAGPSIFDPEGQIAYLVGLTASDVSLMEDAFALASCRAPGDKQMGDLYKLLRDMREGTVTEGEKIL